MEPQLQSWPRRAIPKALVVSLLLHGLMTWVFVTRPEFLFPVPPPPEPEPIPVAFAQPRREKPPQPGQARFEFPDAPGSKEKVRSKIRSDKDRKAQTQDRSRRTAPSAGGASPATQPPVLPPPAPPRGVEGPRKPATAPPKPSQQTETQPVPEPAPPQGTEDGQGRPAPRFDASGSTAFEQQYQELQRSRRQSLVDPTLLQSSVGQGLGPSPSGDDSQGGLLSFDTQADELGPYARILYERIKAAWILPNVAQTIAKGVTEVKFTINRDGTVQDLRVSISSGWAPLDNAALNAIRGARPLPHLPVTFTAERVGVTFRFYVNVPLPPG